MVVQECDPEALVNAIGRAGIALSALERGAAKALNDRSLLRGGMWCPTQVHTGWIPCHALLIRSEWGTRH